MWFYPFSLETTLNVSENFDVIIEGLIEGEKSLIVINNVSWAGDRLNSFIKLYTKQNERYYLKTLLR